MNNVVSYFILILSFLTLYLCLVDNRANVVGDLDMSNGSVNTTKSIRTYELIESYSNKYKIPKYIAYNIAYKETRYKGPFHKDYDPEQTSNMGAVGPMQVMIETANGINNGKVSREELRTNLSINIETSMKLLNRLYKKYGRWDIVCGCYNTGRPMINEYAVFCSTNKDYKNNWDVN